MSRSHPIGSQEAGGGPSFVNGHWEGPSQPRRTGTGPSLRPFSVRARRLPDWETTGMGPTAKTGRAFSSATSLPKPTCSSVPTTADAPAGPLLLSSSAITVPPPSSASPHTHPFQMDYHG
ncbi:hypothetical protein CALCODRAFT_494526 [Calocera cornea HHB12733]|uniref:Uncharacterized protein n=1 Tax=Calocera cornea HHB12733 TaxID=1353952 RepID=A0A165H3N3_9BASI|nr:hypothetical protein CALCODRAFT_494526 [Calocera cornea HHB12733]